MVSAEGLCKKQGQAQGRVQPPPLKRRLQGCAGQGDMLPLSSFAKEGTEGAEISLALGKILRVDERQHPNSPAPVPALMQKSCRVWGEKGIGAMGAGAGL